MIFSFFYFILGIFLYILALPYLLFKSRQTKYHQSIPARFFLKKNPPLKENGIWFHACSMGETKSLKPILEKLQEQNIHISTTTNTGFEQAQKFTKSVAYLPFEIFLPFWIKKQKTLIVMEAELWYFLFLFAKRKHTKTVLINARISDKSYTSYKKFSFFYKKIFNNIDKVFAQSELDKQRLLELGAKNVEVFGNIKLSDTPKVTKQYSKPKDSTIITCASTHENEEQLILDAYKKEQGKLIVVPRHPERFEKVSILLQSFAKENNLSYKRFSHDQSFESDITLVDAMGELINIFAISDIVILGGAFEKIGGHNPVEPAFFNCKIISGEHIFNQKALFECVDNYYIVKNDELLDTMQNIKNLKASKLTKTGDIQTIVDFIEK
jgi:3-deoxy-D-manno-octulosonic-acid transferase